MMTMMAFVLILAQAAAPQAMLGGPLLVASDAGMVREEVPRSVDRGPVLSAASAAVLDEGSGEVLWGYRPYALRPLASTTKLLTAIAVMQSSPSLTAEVMVRAEDIPVEGHTVLRVDDRVRVGDLVTAMLVYSDNGAAYTLSRTQLPTSPVDVVAGVTSLRATARSLGSSTLRIEDPAGLHPFNLGTARDVAMLLREALVIPDLRARLMLPEATILIQRDQPTAVVVRSTNGLLHDGAMHAFHMRGAKTGYIDEAGYNLVLAVDRAGGRPVVLALLGSPSSEERFRDARILADWVLTTAMDNSTARVGPSFMSAWR